jgi:hypothetical protein
MAASGAADESSNLSRATITWKTRLLHCIAVDDHAQEARKLLETDFGYVCSHTDEMLFRKRK